MDSAATGLIPTLLHDFRELQPDLELLLVEAKSSSLLPKLVSGGLDVAIVAQQTTPYPDIHFEFLLKQPIMVALPQHHPLADQQRLRVQDLDGVPLILPSPRSRPHSYNLTMKLFLDADLKPDIAQQAEEKQTIINMVGAEIGAAIIPYWTSRGTVQGVVYKPLVNATGRQIEELPLSVAWIKGTHDSYRDALVALLRDNLDRYSR